MNILIAIICNPVAVFLILGIVAVIVTFIQKERSDALANARIAAEKQENIRRFNTRMGA
jgi:hypothetical protein